MKSLKFGYIKKDIDSCLKISKENNLIVIYSKPIKSDEFLINIVFHKDYFKHKMENKRNIDNDLLFILHLVHNYPINAPKLFCITSLSHIGIELSDGKDILKDVIESEWNSEISANKIILKIPNFIQKCLENKSNKIFLGDYLLDYEYDYNILLKIPHHFFYGVEQIINIKTGKKEKRFLMITSLFFLIFSYKSGYFSFNDFKLTFWGSLYSIIGMKRDEKNLEFEFNKNGNQKILLYLNTKESVNILNLILYILQGRGIDYSVQGFDDNKKLPAIYPESEDN